MLKVLLKKVDLKWGVVAKRLRAQNSSSAADSVQQCVGLNLGRDTCVPEQDTINYCFSPPRGKWGPVRAEMVLVIDLAE